MNYDEYIEGVNGAIIPEEYLLEAEHVIERFLEEVSLQRVGDVSVKDFISFEVEERLSWGDDRVVLFAGGGTDSTYLLLKASEIGRKVDAMSFVSNGNAAALGMIDVICNKLGCTHHKVTFAKSELEGELKQFILRKGRAPRDPVAPLVSMMTKRARELGYQLCVDGQFSDTVFYANPQNNLLRICNHWPRLPGSLANIDSTHRRRKLIQVYNFLKLDISGKILYLCRSEITPKSRDLIFRWLHKYPPQLVMQAIFWHVLLTHRERDKYVINHIPILSPFDNVNLLRKMGREDLGIGKKFLRSFIEARHPDARSLIHSASFRPTR